MWLVPNIVKKSTISPDDYPFVYFSSRLKTLCLIDFSNEEFPMQDLSGNKYTTEEYDTLLPLFNFRQLMSDGLLPDSLDGIEINPRLLMLKTVILRINPTDFSTPKPKLNGMLESMPLRGNLEMPTDMFRFENKIEFIDAKTNTIDYEKSELFGSMLEKRGYTFPTQWVEGNASTRKSYDEGYFCLDSANKLFHIKLVNGNPYIRDTRVSESIDIDRFVIYNAPDKRFYGFVISKAGELYILEANDTGTYTPVKIDIPNIDIKKDAILIMGNLLYWNISVNNNEGESYYAVNTSDLKQVANHHIAKTPNAWDKAKDHLFPSYIFTQSNTTDFVYPQFARIKYPYIAMGIFIILAYIFTRNLSLKEKAFKLILVALTGLAGLIAIIILPNFRK